MIEKSVLLSLIMKIPVYPHTISPKEIGIKNCNLPTNILLGEDDAGFIFFNSEIDKNNALKLIIRDYNEQ